jgi:uroporphyrin-III C-methyltransferase/precorrin-2 dehydrogenase/sirohydrochlorin ferrochelatase
MLPLFLNLTGRRVVLVGGGPVAAAKLRQLSAAGAFVHVIAPAVVDEIGQSGASIERRMFRPSDLDGAWLVVAAATPEVNRDVARAADERRVFVNAVDDPANATAFLSGVVRRGGVTLAISTDGAAPGLTALLREALDALLPRDLFRWVGEARRLRARWKQDGVPMESRRPLLLDALNRLYSKPSGGQAGVRPKADTTAMASPGRVSLVGAGPGDPSLLTRRAVARLRSADLVLYDALIDDRILRYAGRAQRFFVGKRAGRRAMTQESIHALMIRAARRGRHVVRLKGGDPFVFGRGGEEALALRHAGVPFDIVPGVTSAVAAPALAGIPVTHRGLASAFVVVSGHDEQAFSAAVGGLGPTGATLVILMGLGRSAALASMLLDRGWGAATPAAVIVDASSSSQQVWRGVLGDLAEERVVIDASGPGTIVVGDVVSVAEGIRQEERTYVSRR